MRKPIFYELSIQGHRDDELGGVELVASYAITDFNENSSRHSQAMHAVEELVQFTPEQVIMRLMRPQEIKKVRKQINNPPIETWAQRRITTGLGVMLINKSLIFGENNGREKI